MRALRRFYCERQKRRAAWLMRRLYGFAESWLTPREIGRRATRRGGCSCRMCANPRKHWGQATWQERRAASGDGD